MNAKEEAWARVQELHYDALKKVRQKTVEECLDLVHKAFEDIRQGLMDLQLEDGTKPE